MSRAYALLLRYRFPKLTHGRAVLYPTPEDNQVTWVGRGLWMTEHHSYSTKEGEAREMTIRLLGTTEADDMQCGRF